MLQKVQMYLAYLLSILAILQVFSTIEYVGGTPAIEYVGNTTEFSTVYISLVMQLMIGSRGRGGWGVQYHRT